MSRINEGFNANNRLSCRKAQVGGGDGGGIKSIFVIDLNRTRARDRVAHSHAGHAISASLIESWERS